MSAFTVNLLAFVFCAAMTGVNAREYAATKKPAALGWACLQGLLALANLGFALANLSGGR